MGSCITKHVFNEKDFTPSGHSQPFDAPHQKNISWPGGSLYILDMCHNSFEIIL